MCATRISAKHTVSASRPGSAPNLVLYTIPCWVGAYQGSDAYYIFHEDNPARAERADLPRPVLAEIADKSPAQPTHIVGDEGFDPETGTVSEYSKGRGRGDCGTIAGWLWNGSRFALTDYTTMPVCRGLRIDDWLNIVRSRDK